MKSSDPKSKSYTLAVKNSFNESTTHNTMAAMKTQALLQSNTADNSGLESQVAQY